jgi:putative ATP-binding cassette transporter
VSSYTDIAEWRSVVQRLVGFEDALGRVRAQAAALDGIRRANGDATALTVDHVDLTLPSGVALISGVNLGLARGESAILSGPSGAGKSTLIRAIAGIWPFGRGTVTIPDGARALFLPQRPYLPVGTLRRAVCYPLDATAVPDADVRAALEAVNLPQLVERLDQEDAWDRALSGGEQQRLAVARALLVRPDFLFLDEATASMDPEGEERLYTLLKERLPGTAILSIAHRPAVARFHDRGVRVAGGKLAPA